jgi:hypothetical protein
LIRIPFVKDALDRDIGPASGGMHTAIFMLIDIDENGDNASLCPLI